MKAILVTLVLAISLALVQGQQPKPCETPALWMASHFQYDSERQEDSIYENLYYDAIYKRSRRIEFYEEGQEKDAYDVLSLHLQNVEYVYNFYTKNCTKYSPIRHEWRDFGIPLDAKYVGDSYIGSSGIPRAGLLATFWEDEFKTHDNQTIYWMGQWTYEACLPISLDYYIKDSGSRKGIKSHDHFYNIIPGKKCLFFNQWYLFPNEFVLFLRNRYKSF